MASISRGSCRAPREDLLRPEAALPIAERLRAGTLTLGDAFSFCSGLYFRGKITYARRFAPEATFVITPTRGLQSPETIVTADLIGEFAGVDIASDDVRYREPLERDLRALAAQLPSGARVVLLGSVATEKTSTSLFDPLAGRSTSHRPSSAEAT